MSLQTSRLLLREWKPEDLAPFRRINSDPRVMEFYPAPLSPAQSDLVVERVAEHFKKYGFGLYAVQLLKVGELIGFVGLQWVPLQAHFTPAVEIGWRLAAEHWGKGLATEAARAVLKSGFEQHGLAEIVAMTYRGNVRSRRVMEKLGMNYSPEDDFLNPHPQLRGSWLAPHVLYRRKPPL